MSTTSNKELMETAFPFEGTYDGCRVRILSKGNRRLVFIRLQNGRVMIANADRAQINIANSDWLMGDAQRKAFAALAGIPFAEVRKAIAERKRLDEERQRARDIDRCLEEAQRLGLQVKAPQARRPRKAGAK